MAYKKTKTSSVSRDFLCDEKLVHTKRKRERECDVMMESGVREAFSSGNTTWQLWMCCLASASLRNIKKQEECSRRRVSRTDELPGRERPSDTWRHQSRGHLTGLKISGR